MGSGGDLDDDDDQHGTPLSPRPILRAPWCGTNEEGARTYVGTRAHARDSREDVVGVDDARPASGTVEVIVAAGLL
jgi:hypothetical protein